MTDEWQKELSCAEICASCNDNMDKRALRILSVYSHQPICSDCKVEEEKRPDYENMSRQMILECVRTTGKPYGDPEGYCFHHFCPYKC